MAEAYTFTIFDGDPSESGPGSWPDCSEVEVVGDSPDAIAEQALAEACATARGLPDYAPTDSLWVLVWDEDGAIAVKSNRIIGTAD